MPRTPPPRRSLPPLDYLLAFEATATEGSFVGAARVLNISETAISRKVRLLELHFGQTFFVRGQRAIRLTAQGRGFLTRIAPALDTLRAAAQETLDDSRHRPVVLAATNSVAALWLTPRLATFRAENPDLRIMLVASDDDAECLAETVDLSILRGDGTWPGYRAQMLFGETIFPVCTPGFLAEHPAAADLTRLAGVPLIEVASTHTEWMNWRTFLGRHGITRPDLRRMTLFNTYPLSIQAALDGGGVALGWGHLVDAHLERGTLVRPLGETQLRTPHGYFLLVPRDRVPSAGARALADWLRQISARRRRYGPPEPGETGPGGAHGA